MPGSRRCDYKTASGRANWLSRDPLPSAELLQGPNLYAYVANNPVNLVDPDGRCFTPETIWDLLNLLYDAWTGQWDHFTFDLIAAAVPFVPAGTSKLEKLVGELTEAGGSLTHNPLKPGQELNSTIHFGSNERVNIRIETHPLEKGGSPTKHGNVEHVTESGGVKTVTNKHIE